MAVRILTLISSIYHEELDFIYGLKFYNGKITHRPCRFADITTSVLSKELEVQTAYDYDVEDTQDGYKKILLWTGEVAHEKDEAILLIIHYAKNIITDGIVKGNRIAGRNFPHEGIFILKEGDTIKFEMLTKKILTYTVISLKDRLYLIKEYN